MIAPGTRHDLLGNSLVLIAPVSDTRTIVIAPHFDLAGALNGGKLSVADPASVPAGKYAKAALTALGVWDSVSNSLVPAENVRVALSYVSRGEAPLGIVYQTDVAADKSVKIVATFPESAHPPIIYPLAILTKSTNGVAPVYVQYLLSPKAEPFFEKQGFTVY